MSASLLEGGAANTGHLQAADGLGRLQGKEFGTTFLPLSFSVVSSALVAGPHSEGTWLGKGSSGSLSCSFSPTTSKQKTYTTEGVRKRDAPRAI